MTPLVVATNDEIRGLASTILSRDAYARFRTQPEVLKWLDAWRRLEAWLRAVLDGLQDLALTRPWLYACIVGALILVTAALLTHLVYTLRVALAARGAGPAAPRAAAFPEFVAEAEALSRRGRFLDAAQRMQLAVIDLLLRRRVIDLSRADPNRTLRVRLQTAPLPAAERGELLVLLDRFERHWFRDRVEDRDLYEAWCHLHRRLASLPEAQ